MKGYQPPSPKAGPWRGGEPPSPPPVGPLREDESWRSPLTWDGWNYWYTFLVGAFGIFAVGLLAGVLVSFGAEIEDLNATALLTAQTAISLTVIGTLSWTVGSRSWSRDFGFRIQPKHWWAFLAGMGLQLAVALFTAPLLRWLRDDDDTLQGVAEFVAALTGGELVAVAALTIVGAPIVEEVVYRGMLLGRLSRRFNPHVAVLISAGVFSFVHVLFDWSARFASIGLFIVGVVLGYVTLRTRSLSVAILLHAGLNCLAVVLLTLGDDLEQASGTIQSIMWFL